MFVIKSSSIFFIKSTGLSEFVCVYREKAYILYTYLPNLYSHVYTYVRTFDFKLLLSVDVRGSIAKNYITPRFPL